MELNLKWVLLLMAICQNTIFASNSTSLKWVKNFVHYNIYFQNGGSLQSSDLNYNYTQSMIANTIDMCPRPTYRPRKLVPSQVSWKTTKSDDSITTHKVVSAYFAFALLLPGHPYSDDLYDSLVVVAPMYPNILVVVGNAYEFRDMCSQYRVVSYPTLLIFKSGQLISRYKKTTDPVSIARQFSKWTGKPPRSLPNNQLVPAPTRTDINRKLAPIVYPTSWTSINDSLTSMAEHWKHRVAIYQETHPVTEPLMGSFAVLVRHDLAAFAVSGLYVLIRLTIAIYKRLKHRPQIL